MKIVLRLPVPRADDSEPSPAQRAGRALRRGLRPGLIFVFDAAGIACIVYAASLVSVVLAWVLIGAVLLGLSSMIDKDETGRR